MDDERLLTDEEIHGAMSGAVYINLADVKRVAQAQLAKADKARPADREKIDEQVAEMMYDPPCAKGRCGYYDVQGHYCFKPKGQEVFCPMADQILPLFNPDAIRREVAEEIFREIDLLKKKAGGFGSMIFKLNYESLKSRLGGGE